MKRMVASDSPCSSDGRGWRTCLGSWRGISGSCLRAMRIGRRRSSGQMTVEFAVVFPVLLMVGFISVNALVFLGDCAAFDIVARDAIRLQADDGQHEAQGCVEICARIEKGLSMEHEAVSVTSERTAAAIFAMSQEQRSLRLFSKARRCLVSRFRRLSTKWCLW